MNAESDADVRSESGAAAPPTGGSDPLVVAHRGASAAHPENTLEAFAGAAALGADWVELDVRRTADGALIIHHDAHLGDGRSICEVALADLPESVPTFEAALTTCAAHDLGVNVEIKSDPRDPDFDPDHRVAVEVAARLTGDRELGGARRYLVTSFDWRCIARVRDEAPALATGQLSVSITDPGLLLRRASAAGHVAVNPWDPFVDESFMDQARSFGLEVYPWTVDGEERLRQLIELGVDGIITNVPDRLRAILGASR